MNCVSCDTCVYFLRFVCFFPMGVFLSSRVTGACPVTTDLIMRVNVRTTTTTTTTTTTKTTTTTSHRVILSFPPVDIQTKAKLTNMSGYKICQETVSQGKTYSCQGCQTDLSFTTGKAISYTVRFRRSRLTFLRLDSSGPSYRQSSRFLFFVLLLLIEAVGEGVLLCFCMAVETGWQLCASRVPREQRVLRARRTLVQSGLVALDFSRNPPKLRLWRCTQPSAAKATAGVAVVGKNGIDTARCCRRVIHAAGERS